MKPDYRRETPPLIKSILKSNGWTLQEFSTSFGVSYNTAQRWSAGSTSPGRVDFKRIQAASSGQLSLPVEVQRMDSNFGKKLTDEIFKVMADAPGRFTQLGEQIKMLQGDLGVAQKRIEELEKHKKKPISRPSSSRARVERRDGHGRKKYAA